MTTYPNSTAKELKPYIGSMQQLSEQINKGQIVAVKLWRGGTAVSSQTPFSF